MKKVPVETSSIKIKKSTLVRLKKAVGETVKLGPFADLLINQYLDSQKK